MARPMVLETISKLADEAEDIPEWVLTSFNDPDVELVTRTNDVENLKSALFRLDYGGGTDVPEEAFKGEMHNRLKQSVASGEISSDLYRLSCGDI